MDDNELLLAVRDARRELQEGDKAQPKYRTEDMLDILEGLATFLDRDALIRLKCSTCDHYSMSSFSVPDDFTTIDQTEYCHARKISLPHLKVLKIAECKDYSKDARRALVDLATAVLEDDLRPSFEERKIYDRQQFTSHPADFRMSIDCGRACIEFGHMADGEFVGADIKLYILRRLDPGLGQGTEKISKIIGIRPLIAVAMSCKTRKMADIDYVLDWIAGKRKMDIVYL